MTENLFAESKPASGAAARLPPGKHAGRCVDVKEDDWQGQAYLDFVFEREDGVRDHQRVYLMTPEERRAKSREEVLKIYGRYKSVVVALGEPEPTGATEAEALGAWFDAVNRIRDDGLAGKGRPCILNVVPRNNDPSKNDAYINAPRQVPAAIGGLRPHPAANGQTTAAGLAKPAQAAAPAARPRQPAY